MKVSLLIRFGGLTLFVSHFILAIVDGAYFFSGRPAYPPTIIAWMAILGLVFRTFGFVAIFSILAQRGNVFGLVGFILLVIGEFFSVSRLVMLLGVAGGGITGEQLGSVPSFIAITRFVNWFFILGQFIFGVAIYQSKVDMKIIGVLIALLGVLAYLNNPLAFVRPIYAVLTFVAWGWLGWELFTGNDRTKMEPVHTG